MRAKGFSQEVVSALVDRLIELKYLDDANYAYPYGLSIMIAMQVDRARLACKLKEKLVCSGDR
ncbi:MAG: RecX family transcriptional regulator [Acidobacteriota bacterium]|nr:RecX family transcriptional regulator [Blastocatellia bacterium]MDW8412132.1 RecX family transcriptional regulator [Acidobacteriota bacterium]